VTLFPQSGIKKIYYIIKNIEIILNLNYFKLENTDIKKIIG